MRYIWSLFFVIRRNLAIARQRPDILVQSGLVPIVLLTLAAIIFGGSDDWPVAVIDESQSEYSRQFVDAIERVQGESGPYFRIIEKNPERAADLIEAGRLHLVLTIPPQFAETRRVDALTYNINTDAMKNVRLRTTAAVEHLEHDQGARLVSYKLDKVKPVDVSRNAFMAGSAVFLALMLGSMLIAANLFAIEEEGRTRKEILLSPLGCVPAALGAALSALPLAILVALPTLLVAYLFGLRVESMPGLRASLVLLPAMLALSGAGVWVAHILRQHRAIQPAIILMALASYFAAGGFVSVPGLPPAARAFSSVWPPSYVFELANPLLHGFQESVSIMELTVFSLAAIFGLLLAIYAGRREMYKTVGGGQ